jgi:hypothetical protein
VNYPTLVCASTTYDFAMDEQPQKRTRDRIDILFVVAAAVLIAFGIWIVIDGPAPP